VYDFAGYKKLWWDFLNVDDRVETHYIKLKFSAIGTFQRNQQCEWFREWWRDYGVNRTAIDPVYHESYCRHCDLCFEQNIGECFHPIYKAVKEMANGEWSPFYDENYSLKEYMREHLEWLVLTKVKHQIVLGKPMIVRRIFTKAWDELLYKRNRFPALTMF